MGIRKGTTNDNLIASQLIYSSGPVSFDHVFSERHGPHVITFLQNQYALKGSMFSHEHHYLYELDGNVVGCLAYYDKTSHHQTFFHNAKCIWKNYGWRSIAKGLIFEMRLVKAPKKNCLYLSHIAVLAEQQGKGIAKKLIAFAEKKAIENGLNKLSLDVAEQNSGAFTLYQKLGFKIIKRNMSYNQILDNHLYMEKIIGQ